MRVFVSGPMTKGPFERNVRQAIDAAHILLTNGFHPFIPHLYFVCELVYPQDYERWMELDFAFIRVCDAVLRLPGESAGSEREAEFAISVGVPVFYHIEALIAWRDVENRASL